jgi:hypothetical protein
LAKAYQPKDARPLVKTNGNSNPDKLFVLQEINFCKIKKVLIWALTQYQKVKNCQKKSHADFSGLKLKKSAKSAKSA